MLPVCAMRESVTRKLSLIAHTDLINSFYNGIVNLKPIFLPML